MEDIIKEFRDKIIEILTKYTAEEDFMNKKGFAEFCINNTEPIIQKAISQTQKEAYEKGRLETIKEIEEKLPSEQSIGGEEFLVMDTFNKYQVLGHNECLSKIKSILNQLKDNGKY